eukprot:636772-Amphidinium_carterae.1
MFEPYQPHRMLNRHEFADRTQERHQKPSTFSRSVGIFKRHRLHVITSGRSNDITPARCLDA